MRHSIALGLVLFSALASAMSWEAPEVNSYQGEPLEVRIEVTDLAPITPTQIFPLLASEVAFTERGIQRPEHLSGLTYFVDDSNDRVDLVIRTATAWRKPELTTLIEVFTPEGSVLIPVSLEIGESPEKPTQLVVTEILQNPVVEGSLSERLSISESKRANESQVKQQVTLITLNGSTLWRLASRIQPENTTIEQVIMALYDENPDAFKFNNINALEKGQILVVPSARRMRQDAPVEAKKRFDAHMNAPEAIFPRKLKDEAHEANSSSKVTRLSNIPAISESEDETLKESLPEEDTKAQADKYVGEAISLTGLPAMSLEAAPGELSEETILLKKISVLEMKLKEMGANVEVNADSRTDEPNILAEVPQAQTDVINLMPPRVVELFEKISALETKLDQMGAKLDTMVREDQATSQKPKSVIPLSSFAESKLPMEMENWIPSQADVEIFLVTALSQIEAWTPSQVDVETSLATALDQIDGWITSQVDTELFPATQIGMGFLIFVVVLIIVWLLVRMYGQKSENIAKNTQAVSSPDSSVNEFHSMITEPALLVDLNNREADEALESAVERLKAKIEGPTKLQEAEELYSVGDDSLIEAFSADSLNENPEWGEDPDDEADVAAHQLELAQKYLAMGMTQTAVELLARVAVSPDRDSAAKAGALLDVHRS